MKRASRTFFGWGGWSKLASMVTTVAALAALWFTNESLRATSDQAGLARQTAITDRFAKAIEQLGNEKLDVRLGGVYLLERLATDSPNDRPQIFEVLSAFVRTHAPNTAACDASPEAKVSVDVQAVLTVIGRRDMARTEFIDLSNTCLVRASLENANLQGAQLDNANLNSAIAYRVNLSGAEMMGVQLVFARMSESNLSGAHLSSANLQDANLSGADLDGAFFAGADLQGAVFLDASLDRVYFMQADVRGTWFTLPPVSGTGFQPHITGDDPAVERRTSQDTTYRGASWGDMRFDARTLWPADFTH
ncbi:pentapeptide repeat-containing protein [Nocardia sp. NPDC005978]|uniref:pentapeptide repeat-containing protein n=1 Tax=Nocardia sp. NPDC005978 TaxID=3156725 RepID=UPI0033B9A3DA